MNNSKTYFAYVEASAGLSGDMMLGALLDLGVEPSLFKEKMAGLKLPVEIKIRETKRASLRSLKVDIEVKRSKQIRRRWPDIESFIKASSFSARVKKNSLAVFKKLFEAEAKVHGRNFQETHLHEAGADDAIIDIMGSCYLAERLHIEDFYCSPLNVGQGWVKTSHGHLAVPPPAVAEILRSIPVYSAWAKEELVTPTGAAIISTLAKKFISFPELCYQKIGYGAGHRNFANFPNILRIFYGEKKNFQPEKKVYLIEASIDDSNPQMLGAFLDTALNLGALDVFLTPVVMKKNRLATKLTVLAEIDKIDNLIEAVFKETSTIGVRYFPLERRVLDRELNQVTVLGEKIALKTAYYEGKEINVQPEFSDCLKVAKKYNLPLKEVFQRALKELSEKRKK
ncbi:MAG: nickel pincer cofactor biosynthesis protein LarC [Candidatus Aminicenantales bacterium]